MRIICAQLFCRPHLTSIRVVLGEHINSRNSTAVIGNVCELKEAWADQFIIAVREPVIMSGLHSRLDCSRRLRGKLITSLQMSFLHSGDFRLATLTWASSNWDTSHILGEMQVYHALSDIESGVSELDITFVVAVAPMKPIVSSTRYSRAVALVCTASCTSESRSESR